MIEDLQFYLRARKLVLRYFRITAMPITYWKFSKEGFWPDSGLPISISLSNQINNLIWILHRTRYWNSMEKRCRKLEDRVLSCQSLQEFTGRVYATGNPQACFELGTGQTEISLRIPIGTQCGSVQSVSFKIQGEYFANKSGSDNRCS